MLTIEQARERLGLRWVLQLKDGETDPWLDLIERIAQEFVAIDREARQEELKTLQEYVRVDSLRDSICVGSMREIERRLKEIKDAR